MNRKQRRHMTQGQFKMMPINELVTPQQMARDAARLIAGFRLRDNLEATGHPFHHLTQSGVVVDADPTLEQLFSKLEQSEQDEVRSRWMQKVRPNALPAVPVNRNFYGHDPYEESRDHHEPRSAT
jgi:hypothetical protein